MNYKRVINKTRLYDSLYSLSHSILCLLSLHFYLSLDMHFPILS